MTHCDPVKPEPPPPPPMLRGDGARVHMDGRVEWPPGKTPRTPTAVWFKRLHAIAVVFWIAMIPPTILWWKDSVSYLVFISLYTIIIDHVTAWQASRLERQQEKKDERSTSEG